MKPLIDSHQHKAAIRQAEILRLDTGAQLGYEPEPDGTKLERAFLGLCRRHRIPAPQTQVIVGPYTVDFQWSEERLIVETDGYATHGSRSAFEADRARDAQLKSWGYEVLRVTYRQVTRESATVAAALSAVLAGRVA